MYYQLIETAAALFALIPVMTLLHFFRVRDLGRSILYFLFSFYLAVVYHLTGLPTVLFMTFDVNLNLIPHDLFTKELVFSVLNIAMFVPLGFFLPLLWEKYRNIRNTLLFALGATVTIELLQLLTFRATDINDVITNSLGAFLGHCVFRMFRIATAGSKKTRDIPLIFSIVGLVMFFIQPFVASLLYEIR